MAETGRAIVIGASIAGLLAAHVLSHHFDEVVIVERDTLPKEPEFRKGVPQSRHLHVLLARGAEILEQFFPGFRESLFAAGAQPIDWTRDVLQHGQYQDAATVWRQAGLRTCLSLRSSGQ